MLPLFLLAAYRVAGTPDAVNVLAAKQDHAGYNYYTLRDEAGLSMPAVAADLGIEYIGPVGKLSYRLFRSAKDSAPAGEIVARFHAQGLAAKYAIDDFQHDVPKQKSLLSTETDGFKKQWHLVTPAYTLTLRTNWALALT